LPEKGQATGLQAASLVYPADPKGENQAGETAETRENSPGDGRVLLWHSSLISKSQKLVNPVVIGNTNATEKRPVEIKEGSIMSMMTYTRPLSEIREQIEQLFSDFAEESRMPMQNTWPTTGMKSAAWLPPIEVSESDRELNVSASLPGMKPEDINVEVVGNTLTLSGESRRESKMDEKHCHRSEFQYGQFMRRIPLPDYVNGEQCQASFNNGVLEIHLPKMEGTKSKKIEVQTGH